MVIRLTIQKQRKLVLFHKQTAYELTSFMLIFKLLLIRHYVEGLPFEYRAVVRLKTTLVEAMDEARKIVNDIAIRDRTTVRSGEKHK
uniref:Uncharacterized protein n=1 Tax=Lactuca sativa TaxID=4236 RepID=A0A9R1X0R1_LACSA|nr:hypothetical protein LSAT_V11C700369390 [Lactuca sativa]